MLMSLFQMISKLYKKQLNIWKQLPICSAEGGEGITVSLKEPLETEYTLTLIDGQPTQANHIFGRIIQGIE